MSTNKHYQDYLREEGIELFEVLSEKELQENLNDDLGFLYHRSSLDDTDFRLYLSGYICKYNCNFVAIGSMAEISPLGNMAEEYASKFGLHPEHTFCEIRAEQFREDYAKVLVDRYESVAEIVISGLPEGSTIAYTYISYIKELLSFFGYRVRVRMEE